MFGIENNQGNQNSRSSQNNQDNENNGISAVSWFSLMLPLLEEGHELKLCPSGTSMVPFITGGRDEVYLRSASGKTLKRGDIVLYVRSNGEHILHRIHHKKNDSYFMLGDSHMGIEGPVDRKNILAVAVSFIRKNKKIGCTELKYKILSEIWLIMRPLRPLVFSLQKKIKRPKR